MAPRTTARVITYGRSPQADVRATDICAAWPDHLSLTVSHDGKAVQVRTRLVGSHWTTSVVAAVSCGIVCGIDLKACAKAIENFEPMFGRYSTHPLPKGPVYVFDHKAPIWTIPISLDFVKEARAPHKTIVLGTISNYPGGSPAGVIGRLPFRLWRWRTGWCLSVHSPDTSRNYAKIWAVTVCLPFKRRIKQAHSYRRMLSLRSSFSLRDLSTSIIWSAFSYPSSIGWSAGESDAEKIIHVSTAASTADRRHLEREVCQGAFATSSSTVR